MKLAIITRKFVKGTGQGRVNHEVARAAVRRGHRVVLLASEVAPELLAEEAVLWVPIPGGDWPTALLRDQLFAWRTMQWLIQHRGTLDLVVANGCNTWAPAEVNAVHFVHSAWRRSPVHVARVRRGPYAWYQWLYSALNAYWEKRAFRKAQTIIAVSDQVRSELVEIGVTPDKICVIHNGVDVAEFKPGPTNRTALGLPEDVPLALFVGDIRTPRKNLDTVLKALQKAPDVHLGVVGSTDRSPYPQMARTLDVHARVHFLGFRRDVPDLMRAADIFVFPSRYEACSLVLLEALASGLPIVTARTAGGAELITKECGIVLDNPDGTDDLADALRMLAQDRRRRKALGTASRTIAEEHSWLRMADQYLELFETMRNAARPRPTREVPLP